MEEIISTSQKTISTDATILELRGFFGIHNDNQWLQIRKDATEIYETGITALESSVKSWGKLSQTLQETMIRKVRTFLFNIDC